MLFTKKKHKNIQPPFRQQMFDVIQQARRHEARRKSDIGLLGRYRTVMNYSDVYEIRKKNKVILRECGF